MGLLVKEMHRRDGDDKIGCDEFLGLDQDLCFQFLQYSEIMSPPRPMALSKKILPAVR